MRERSIPAKQGRLGAGKRGVMGKDGNELGREEQETKSIVASIDGKAVRKQNKQQKQQQKKAIDHNETMSELCTRLQAPKQDCNYNIIRVEAKKGEARRGRERLRTNQNQDQMYSNIQHTHSREL